MEKISNKDAAMVFRQAASEIEGMRQRIAILQAKEDVLNIFQMALSGKRPDGQCYGEDIVWKLKKAADAIASRDHEST